MFYKILVGSASYHGVGGLTYQSELNLQPGHIVSVPLRGTLTTGIVEQKTSKPEFSAKAIQQLLNPNPLPASSLLLLTWLQAYYPAPIGSITQLFVPSNLLRSTKKRVVKDKKATAKTTVQTLPALTAEQSATVSSIVEAKNNSSFFLHGQTGSGKTRVYIEVASRQLAKKRSVIVLVPEISLTSQIAQEFQKSFGDQVVIVHSHLTEGERRDRWRRILETTTPLVVLGARSALFHPIQNLGLLVVDEAHESAYKQEQAPKYVATRVASKLAELHQAILIFGSATPSITDYYIAQQKAIPILRMRQLATATHTDAATLKIIDLKDKHQFTRHNFLSNDLLQAIQKTLDNDEQSLVFLNRRGTARVVLCSSCGWQACCPICDLPLTYHGDSHDMRCHTCGYKTAALASCPVCQSPDIVFRNIGTKAIVESLAHIFPQARVQRFDTDNKKAERFEQHYQAVSSGEVDILVGTQVLAKGLDLPKLALVGIVAADTSLYFPDYTAEERTFQLLTQVLGRVGRGHRASQAIIQTYHPDSQVIAAAINQDYERFYTQQLKERQLFRFPPFAYLLKISGSRANQKSIIGACEKLLAQLRSFNLPIQIIGPSPCFHEKTKDKYHWQLIVKAKNRADLLKVVHKLPPSWTYDLDPVNLL